VYYIKNGEKIMNNKKGAMFGLDARIALAIFGALSVISGAALYSAIQDSKITSMYSDIVEFEKAVESVYLDLGEFPTEEITSGNFQPDLRYIFENPGSNSFWRGPYYQSDYEIFSDHFEFRSSKYYNFKLVRGTPVNCSGTITSTSIKDIYINITGYNKSVSPSPECRTMDLSFLKQMHDKFDSDGDYSGGKIRVYASTSSGFESKGGIFYKISVPIIN
tara:strand:+ start:1310 stop:1966 length:657 start_codon:yes stop_codon:yes gene_type:complete